MKKKLTSFLLGALLLGQSSPLLAVNTEAEPVHTPAPITPHTETFFEKYRKFIIGGACALGVGAIATPIIYYLTHSGKDNQTIHNFAYRQLLKEAVRKLHTNNRFLVLGFPADKADAFLSNPNNKGNDNIKSVLIACALYESFLKDSDVINDEKLFKLLESNIPENSNCDLETTLVQHVQNAIKCVSDLNSQPHIHDDGGPFTPPARADEGQQWKNIVAYRSYRDEQDQFIRDAASKWTQTPIRALAWHGDMCYFNATILLFFHNPVYYNLIMNIDHAKAEKLINDPDTDDKTKANLKCIVYLSYLFNAMTGTNKEVPQVITLNRDFTGDTKDRIETLNANDFESKLGNYFEEKLFCAIKFARLANGENLAKINRELRYCSSGHAFTRELLTIIQNSKEVLYPADYAELPELTTNADRFVNCPQVRLLSEDDCLNLNVDHYLVRIELEKGKYLSIGEQATQVNDIGLSELQHTEIFNALHTILEKYVEDLSNEQKTQITTNVPDDLLPKDEIIDTLGFTADYKLPLSKLNILLGLSRALKENNLDPAKNYNLYNQLKQYFLLQKWKLTDLEQNKTPDYLENFLNEITEDSEDIVKNTWKRYLDLLYDTFQDNRKRVIGLPSPEPSRIELYFKLLPRIKWILDEHKIDGDEFTEYKTKFQRCLKWYNDDVNDEQIPIDNCYEFIARYYILKNNKKIRDALENLHEKDIKNGNRVLFLRRKHKRTALEYNTLLLLKQACKSSVDLSQNDYLNKNLRNCLKEIFENRKPDLSELANTLDGLLARAEEISNSVKEILEEALKEIPKT